jgi:hypothetical protein
MRRRRISISLGLGSWVRAEFWSRMGLLGLAYPTFSRCPAAWHCPERDKPIHVLFQTWFAALKNSKATKIIVDKYYYNYVVPISQTYAEIQCLRSSALITQIDSVCSDCCYPFWSIYGWLTGSTLNGFYHMLSNEQYTARQL